MCAVPEVSAADPADDDPYQAYFRDEPARAEPVAVAGHQAEAAPPQADVDPAAPAPEPPAEPEPAPARARTGRLFRSAGAADNGTAVLAVPADRGKALRTLHAAEAPPPVRDARLEPDQEAAMPVQARERRASRASRTATRARGLNTLGVVVVIGAVTALLGAIDIFVGGPGLGPVTGIGFVLASAFAATRVRLDDASIAVIVPPLVFWAAAVTLGQIGQVSTAGLLSRGVIVFFMLASNWVWIIGGTAAALAIVLVRGRQSR